METVSLFSLRPGARAKVARLCGRVAVIRRLAELGLTPGTEIKLEGFAPFGGPAVISLRRGKLTLRESEAADVLVVPVARGER